MTSEENISESGLTLSGEDLIMSNRFTCIEKVYSSKKGYATMYRAQRMGKWHTLKCLKEEYADSLIHLGLLRKEFDICYRLSHPNIVSIMGLENIEGLGLCIVMEYVDGYTLRHFMDEGRLTKATAENIISQICDALTYIHSLQIIHRDLKPENIMITRTGNHVKLIDFGCSDADSYAVLKLPAGTRRYSAPEQVVKGKIDARADLFALGIIIGEINGTLPYGSYKLKRIAKRCTRKEPEKRYASAGEIKLFIERRSNNLLIAISILFLTLASAVYFYYPNKAPDSISTPVIASKNIVITKKPAKENMEIPKENVTTSKPVKNINTDDRLTYLIKFAKENTVKILDDTYRQLKDSTLDKEYRRKLSHSYYFNIEKTIHAEVDRVIPKETSENAVAWNTIRNVVAETSKDYHSKNKIVYE